MIMQKKQGTMDEFFPPTSSIDFGWSWKSHAVDCYLFAAHMQNSKVFYNNAERYHISLCAESMFTGTISNFGWSSENSS